MGKGKNETFTNDWISSFDPRVAPGLAAQKGTLFRYIPSVGPSQLLLKQDDGLSTNWQAPASAPTFVYYVGANTEFTTIQSAIDQAVADGVGNGTFGTIYVAPGVYVENLVFAPCLSIVGMCSNAGIGAIQVQGQHVYNPGVQPDPLLNFLGISNLTFIDTLAGHTISFGGAGDAIIQLNFSNWIKAGASGSFLYSAKVTSIVSAGQCATINSLSVDPMFDLACNVVVLFWCIHTAGSPGGLLDYNGTGFANVYYSQAQTQSPYVLNLNGGQLQVAQSFLTTFATDADCIRVGAGLTAYISNSTLIAPPGLGYVLQGSGTVNGAMIVYGIVNTKDPALTFNLLPSDP